MDYQARQRKASSGTFAETASFGELDVLATLWAGVADAVKIADPKNLAGKGVIDVTNHLDLSGISYSHCLLEIQGKSCLTLTDNNCCNSCAAKQVNFCGQDIRFQGDVCSRSD